MGEDVWNAVGMPLDADVVIRAGSGLDPFGALVGMGGQGCESGTIEAEEEFESRPGHLAKGAPVECVEEPPDGGIEFLEAQMSIPAQAEQ